MRRCRPRRSWPRPRARLHRQLGHAGPSRRRRARDGRHLPLPLRPAGARPADCCVEDRRLGARAAATGWLRRRGRRLLRDRPRALAPRDRGTSARASRPCWATCRSSSWGSSPGGCCGERPEPPADRCRPGRARRRRADLRRRRVPAPTASDPAARVRLRHRHVDRVRRLPAASCARVPGTCAASPARCSTRRPSRRWSAWRSAPISGGVDLVPSWPSHGWLVVLALTSQVRRVAADRGLAAAGAGGADLGDPPAAAGRLGGAVGRSCSTSGRPRCS